MNPFNLPIPRAAYQFGQKVTVHWHEAELGVTEAIIIGMNYNPYRHHAGIEYTVTEVNNGVTDGIDEGMLSPC